MAYPVAYVQQYRCQVKCSVVPQPQGTGHMPTHLQTAGHGGGNVGQMYCQSRKSLPKPRVVHVEPKNEEARRNVYCRPLPTFQISSCAIASVSHHRVFN